MTMCYNVMAMNLNVMLSEAKHLSVSAKEVIIDAVYFGAQTSHEPTFDARRTHPNSTLRLRQIAGFPGLLRADGGRAGACGARACQSCLDRWADRCLRSRCVRQHRAAA